MSEYRAAGAAARRQGLPRDKNPYSRDCDKYHDWDDGWLGKSPHRPFMQPCPTIAKQVLKSEKA